MLIARMPQHYDESHDGDPENSETRGLFPTNISTDFKSPQYPGEPRKGNSHREHEYEGSNNRVNGTRAHGAILPHRE